MLPVLLKTFLNHIGLFSPFCFFGQGTSQLIGFKLSPNRSFDWDHGSNISCRKELFNFDTMHSPRRYNKLELRWL